MTQNVASEQSWTSDRYDKSEWGEGPWRREPDKVQWIDPATDLDCLAVRNHMGAWCGYVGVPPEHPWHGKGYDDVDVDVHGGLTFAETCQDEFGDPAWGVCHVPAPGRPANVWWLGFDTAHAWDLVPGLGRFLGGRDDVYRDLAYVRAECTGLASQVSEAAA